VKNKVPEMIDLLQYWQMLENFWWEIIAVRLPLTPILTFSGDRQSEITAERNTD
jgi:hypothetical protein